MVTQPINQARLTVGVGEDVILTFSSGSATWSTTGGTLSSAVGNSVTWTAPQRSASVTITAKGTNCTAQITFNVIEPSVVNQKQYPGTTVQHTHNEADVGMYTQVYIGPDSVNFYKIQWLELEIGCTATCPGVYCWNNGNGHGPNKNPLPMTETVIPGLGTLSGIPGGGVDDHIYSGYQSPPTLVAGSETWQIPWQFQVGSGALKTFATVAQQCSLGADLVTLTASKAGATVTCKLGDPTSNGNPPF